MKITKTAKKTILNVVILAVLIGITLTVLFLSHRELNFANIGEFLLSGESWCIAAAVLCMLGFIFFEGLSLFVIARSLGHRSKLHQSMAYSAADVYYSAITPSASGGQPASLAYMVRDGMSAGLGGFSLMLYLLEYTAAIFVMGAFAFIARPEFFGQLGDGFARMLVIVGCVIQTVLLGFFITCLVWSKMLKKVGNGFIGLLAKIRIVKNPDKWREKWTSTIDRYSASRTVLNSHPWLVVVTLILNICQRVSQTLIPCFVCYAVSREASFVDLFCMQVYVLLGYGSIPLPGGVGVYELMFLRTYGIFYSEKFMLSAMMVSRTISYYLSMIVSGAYTLTYHIVGIKRPRTMPEITVENENIEAEESPENPPDSGDTGENIG